MPIITDNLKLNRLSAVKPHAPQGEMEVGMCREGALILTCPLPPKRLRSTTDDQKLFLSMTPDGCRRLVCKKRVSIALRRDQATAEALSIKAKTFFFYIQK